MKLEEYLAEERIEKRVMSVFRKAEKSLPKDAIDMLKEIEESLFSGPESPLHWLPIFYNFFAEHKMYDILWRYRKTEAAKGIDFVMSELNGSKKVLDIGCADGLKTVYYALTHPDTRFVGIDKCREPIKRAEERAKKYGLKNIEFVQASLLDTCFTPKSFDAVIATSMLHEDFMVCYGFYHGSGLEVHYKFDKQVKAISPIVANEGKLLITLSVDRDGVDDIKSQVDYAAENAGLKNGKIKKKRYGRGDYVNYVLDFVCVKP